MIVDKFTYLFGRARILLFFLLESNLFGGLAKGVARLTGLQFFIAHPIHNHVSFALDRDLSSLAGRNLRGLFLKNLVGGFRTKNAIGLGVGLHARGSVDGITKETIAGIQGSNYITHNSTTMEADANVDVALGRVFVINKNLAGFIHQINGKQCRMFGMSVHLLLFQVSDTHIGIANCLDLEDLVLAGDRVKSQIKAIEHLADLEWGEGTTNVGKMNNIRKDNRHFFVLFRFNLLTSLELISNVLGE